MPARDRGPLAAIGEVSLECLDAVLVAHEHSDRYMRSAAVLKVPRAHMSWLTGYDAVGRFASAGHLQAGECLPLVISKSSFCIHDTADPVGFA